MRNLRLVLLTFALLLMCIAATAARKPRVTPTSHATTAAAPLPMFDAGNPEVDITVSNDTPAHCKVWQPLVHASTGGYVLFKPTKDIWVIFTRSDVLKDGGDADHPGRTQILANNGDGTKVAVVSTATDAAPDYTQFIIEGCANHPGPPIKPSNARKGKKRNSKGPFDRGSDPNEIIVP